MVGWTNWLALACPWKNLFTIDNYKIADPEAGVTRNDNNEVINSNGVLSYPLQRTITFGANITF